MAYTTINKSTDHFNTKLYTGTGSSNAITGVGFQPDWVWIKNRSANANHHSFDVVRGVTKDLSPNLSNAESTDAQKLTTFGTDGFTVGTNGNVNGNGNNIVSWNWKAGTTSSISGGSITPSSVSINTTSGFGIYKWTGTGSTGTIAHGLGAVPKFMFIKNLSSAESWRVYHHSLGNATSLKLNTSDATFSDTGAFNSTTPTSTLFTVGNSDSTNKSGDSIIAYVFAEKTGYSKFGSYIANGAASDANFIYTGFKPAWVLFRKTTGDNWLILDNKRSSTSGGNLLDFHLRANLSNAEEDLSSATNGVDFLSNGIKLRKNNGEFNTSGVTFIYIAFGQSLVGSNNVPCTAR